MRVYNEEVMLVLSMQGRLSLFTPVRGLPGGGGG